MTCAIHAKVNIFAIVNILHKIENVIIDISRLIS